MRSKLAFADKWVDRLGYWGGWVVLTFIYQRLSGSASLVEGFNWADRVLLSVAGALLTLLVFAATLALYRVFRPVMRGTISGSSEQGAPLEIVSGRKLNGIVVVDGKHFVGCDWSGVLVCWNGAPFKIEPIDATLKNTAGFTTGNRSLGEALSFMQHIGIVNNDGFKTMSSDPSQGLS